MKKAIRVTAWILAAVAFLATIDCSDDCNCPVVVQPGHDVIWPLKIGNSWTYLDSLNNTGTWSEFESSITVTGRRTVAVDTFLYDAFECVMIDSLFNDPTTMHLLNTELDGLVQYGITCASDSIRLTSVYAEYPTQPGRTYLSYFMMCGAGNPTGMGPGVAVCTHTDTSYVTPAGTFKCYRYTQHYNVPVFGEFDVFLYMVPGLGLVGHEFHTENAAWKKRLSSYTLE